MADFFFIEEYSVTKGDANGNLLQVTGNPIAVHKIPLSLTPTQITIPFNPATIWIQIQTDEDAYYRVGDNTVVASSSDRLLYCRHMRPVTVDSGHFTHISCVLRSD